ncbi:tyrosine-type recombinase/integrase [Chloroflexia bacterium SDU3-3]|nr:tyrosine-type recombinase/integrase [Chloroflexia bacterium SDU3-3]
MSDPMPPTPLAPAPAALAEAPLPVRSVADLVSEVILRGKSAKTKAAYRADLEHFLAWRCGPEVTIPVALDALRPATPARARLDATMQVLQQTSEADIHRYRDHVLHDLGMTPSSWNRRLSPLKQLFRRLQRYQLIRLNPCEDVGGERLSARSKTMYLTRAQARALVDSCEGASLKDLRDQALIHLMLSTGLRSFEIIDLRIEHCYSLDGHMVAAVLTKGMENDREIIKLTPATWATVRRWLDAAGITDGPIFRRLSARGPRVLEPGQVRTFGVQGALSYQGLYFILTERFTNAGLEQTLAQGLSPHSLRHSFVTLAIRGGASVTQAQAAARHKDPRTTMRYAHDLQNLDDNAVDYVKF